MRHARSEQATPQRHMLHMVAEAMLGADRVAKITGNGPGTANSAAHMSQRAALRPKSSLAVAHSGEIVHTARIDVLVKPQVVALHTRGLIFHSYLLAELAELGARRERRLCGNRGG